MESSGGLLDQFQKEGGWGPSFLGTVSPDGRPHSAGFGPTWYDATMYFVSGPGTRKSRNIARKSSMHDLNEPERHGSGLRGQHVQSDHPEILEKLAAALSCGRLAGRRSMAPRLTAPYSAPSGGSAAVEPLPASTAKPRYGVGAEEPPKPPAGDSSNDRNRQAAQAATRGEGSIAELRDCHSTSSADTVPSFPDGATT